MRSVSGACDQIGDIMVTPDAALGDAAGTAGACEADDDDDEGDGDASAAVADAASA